MAFEADRVVVEVIAKMDGLDTPVKQSAATFDANMNKIAASAAKAETVVTKSSAARISALQRESAQITAAARIIGTQLNDVGAILASPNSPFVAPVREGPKVASAMRLVSTGGTLLGNVLGGVMLSAGVAAIAMLVDLARKSGDESREINELVEKLKEHARQTHLSEEADRIWAQTLDGLIERQKKLNEELGKRLEVQAAVDISDLARQKGDLAAKQKELDDETARLAGLRKQLAAEGPVTGSGPGFEARAGEQAARVGSLQKQIRDSEITIGKLKTALGELQIGIQKSEVVIGEAQGKALADAAERVKRFSDLETDALRNIFVALHLGQGDIASASGAFDALTKSMEEAAGVEVPFQSSEEKANNLARSLKDGKITVASYTTEIKKLAAALHDQAEAAKEANKNKVDPVKQFKQSIIGAEGVGPNKMGSSAAGFGQFMPATFQHYFNQAFPNSGFNDQQISDLRNKRQIAEAVIDVATNDYVKVLKAAGQKVTEASLYTVHLLSAGDPKARVAMRLLNAPASEPTSNFLSPGVLKGNPFLKGTAADARAAIAKRIGDSSSAVSQGAAAIAQLLDQEKERLRRYQEQRAALEDDALSAKQALATSAEENAKFESAAVEASRQRYENNVKALQDEGKYTGDEAKELIRINDERAKYRQELVQRRLDQERFREQEARNENALNVQTGLFDTQKELLQSEEGLAKTASERKRIEDRLIDIQFEEERMRLQAQISLADRLKAEAARTKSAQDLAAAERAEADAAVARQRLKNLPQEQANAHTANAQTNASPLKAYLDSIPNTAEEINAALENVAAQGLQTFTDALTDAIVNFKSLGDVARTVLQQITAMLVKMAIQQLILHAFAALAGGGQVGGMATGGRIRGYAPGGYISGPGGPTSDSVPIMASAGEFIVRTEAARKIGYGTLDHINRLGELPHFADGGQVRRIAPMNERAWSQHNSAELSPQAVQALRSIVSEAAAAMPHVDLYASLDPAEVLQKALGTPTGHRAMLGHFRSNSGAFNASLRPGG